MRAARRTSSRTEKSSTPFGTRSSSSRRPRSGPPSTRWGRTSTSRRASAANPIRAKRSTQASAGPRSDSGTCTSGDPMEDVSSRIVEKAIGLGCQDAIADVITNRSYQIQFAQNEAVISNRWRESTASVFFVYDKRVLASDIKDLTQLDAAVERLVKIAKGSQQNPDYAGIADGPFRYARVRPDPKVLSLDEGGKYVEAAIGGATDEGAKECAGSFWKYEDEHFLSPRTAWRGTTIGRASTCPSGRSCRLTRAVTGSPAPRGSPNSIPRKPGGRRDASRPWRGRRSPGKRADTRSCSTRSSSG